MSVETERVDAVVTPPRPVVPGGTRASLPAAPVAGRGLARILGSHLVPYVARQARSVGGAGVVGVALLVFAGAFFTGANSPLKSELASLQATLDTAPASEPTATGGGVRRDDLQAFIQRLPRRSELPAITTQVVAQAAACGVTLERGTYDFTVTHSGQLVRARMSFPVHGRYPDVRRFIDGTLAANPGVAVDGLRFERKDVGAAEIDADVRFALYLRAGS